MKNQQSNNIIVYTTQKSYRPNVNLECQHIIHLGELFGSHKIRGAGIGVGRGGKAYRLFLNPWQAEIAQAYRAVTSHQNIALEDETNENRCNIWGLSMNVA